jgi:hypothetical protein
MLFFKDHVSSFKTAINKATNFFLIHNYKNNSELPNKINQTNNNVLTERADSMSLCDQKDDKVRLGEDEKPPEVSFLPLAPSVQRKQLTPKGLPMVYIGTPYDGNDLLGTVSWQTVT